MKKFLIGLARIMGAGICTIVSVFGLVGVLAYYQELMALPFAIVTCVGLMGAVMCITDEPHKAPAAKSRKTAAASTEVAA